MIPKFRVWILNTKEMENVVSIDMNSDAITCEIEYAYGLLFITGRKPDGVLMQSTGLKDLNGVEIYEGDIVKPVSFASWIGVVKYSPENAAYILDDHNNEFIRGENVYLSQFNEGLEIIGNIYENPELMEV